jgi:hypothetical protein
VNRETWLLACVEECRKSIFEPNDLWLPQALRISCGLCPGKAIGVCMDPECAEDEGTEIFVDPKLTDAVEIIAVVVHELCHASVGLEWKHKGKFIDAIRTVGLEGKPTATYISPGTELFHTANGIAVKLGPYPGVKLTRKAKETKKRHAWQTFLSTSNPEYMIRANTNVVKEFGAPTDPWGQTMVLKDPEPEEETPSEES